MNVIRSARDEFHEVDLLGELIPDSVNVSQYTLGNIGLASIQFEKPEDAESFVGQILSDERMTTSTLGTGIRVARKSRIYTVVRDGNEARVYIEGGSADRRSSRLTHFVMRHLVPDPSTNES